MKPPFYFPIFNINLILGQEMGGDGGQPPAKRVRMGGNNGVGVPVTYHHQVQVI